MEIAIEGITNLIKTTLLILSIPLFYIQTRKTTLEKALTLIEDISSIVIFRLSHHHLISRKDIKGIIKSKAYSLKINSDVVLIDDVLNKVLEKIEENPFLTKRQRRRSLEGAKILKENKESTKLKHHLFIKNYEKQIYSILILSIVLVLILFPENWSLYNELNSVNKALLKLISYFLLSLILLSFLIFLINLINSIFNPKLNWGLVKIKSYTFSKLPDYFDENLKFNTQYGIKIFNLVNVDFSEKDNVVETDQGGCLGFGIMKAYKKHQTYVLNFVESIKEYPKKISISIESKSFTNGMYDLNFINYEILSSDKVIFNAKYPVAANEDESRFVSSFNSRNSVKIQSLDQYLDFKNVIIVKDSGNELILDNNEKMIAIKFEKELWTLLPSC